MYEYFLTISVFMQHIITLKNELGISWVRNIFCLIKLIPCNCIYVFPKKSFITTEKANVYHVVRERYNFISRMS